MITVKINEHSRKGKLLFEMLLSLEESGYCSIVRIPNSKLIKSFNEAKEGKFTVCKSDDDLSKTLKSEAYKSLVRAVKEVKQGKIHPIDDLFK